MGCGQHLELGHRRRIRYQHQLQPIQSDQGGGSRLNDDSARLHHIVAEIAGDSGASSVAEEKAIPGDLDGTRSRNGALETGSAYN
jgi:hypothetical protein